MDKSLVRNQRPSQITTDWALVFRASRVVLGRRFLPAISWSGTGRTQQEQPSFEGLFSRLLPDCTGRHGAPQHRKGSSDQTIPQAFFLLRRHLRPADRVVDGHAVEDPVGSHSRGNRGQSCDDDGRNTLSFYLPGERCTATCTGSSCADKQCGQHATFLQIPGDFPSHASCIGKGRGVACGYVILRMYST